MPLSALPTSTLESTPSSTVPATAAILIGTNETIAQARKQLAAMPDPPHIVGCLLADSTQPDITGDLTVLGTLDDLDAIRSTHEVSTAIVSLPAPMSQAITTVRSALRKHGFVERFLPPIAELLAQAPPYPVGLATGSTNASWGVPRIDIADLIGRSPHGIDHQSVGRILRGKRVLLTGAGGSIGSELCRIAASFKPEMLILMERSENALFEIDRQIAERFPDIPRRAILHDVTDADQTLRHLVDLKPHVVFHAAAHKHVPLMEDHPSHAVTNNLFGTKSIADASIAVGAERFVMISSDKAVNPTSVMGATKRLAELYIQSLARAANNAGGTSTQCSMVRFGNVLGSACSVLTIWSAQLAEGGPISVTDPRMTRFFMTIPEAATLVIQAAAIETDPGSAHVYVLDMGDPLLILGLAKRFVAAHGFFPRVEGENEPNASGLPPIDIQVTGVRPGEKLHEELAYNAELLNPTPHSGINAWAGDTAQRDMLAMIAELSAVRSNANRGVVLEAIRRHVPEMVPAAVS